MWYLGTSALRPEIAAGGARVKDTPVMHRVRRSLAIAAVVGTAIPSACSRRADEPSPVRWVGSGADLHLVGAGVFRYPRDTDFVERRRYVMQGRRLPGGFCEAHDSASEVLYPSRSEPATTENRFHYPECALLPLGRVERRAVCAPVHQAGTARHPNQRHDHIGRLPHL